MKIGDLVRHKHPMWRDSLGLIIKEIPGWGQMKVVRWTTGDHGTYAARQLEVINEIG